MNTDFFMIVCAPVLAVVTFIIRKFVVEQEKRINDEKQQRMYDYILKEQIIMRQHEIDKMYYKAMLRTERPRKKNRLCPNCGAPVSEKSDCEYCGIYYGG